MVLLRGLLTEEQPETMRMNRKDTCFNPTTARYGKYCLSPQLSLNYLGLVLSRRKPMNDESTYSG